MYPPSYYTATAHALPLQEPLGARSRRLPTCASSGAGYTGLSAALHLAQAGKSVVVLESQRIGWGASGRNGGQLFGGQRQDVDWLEAHYGHPLARQLWDLGEAAKRLVKQLIAELAIDCELTPGVASLRTRRVTFRSTTRSSTNSRRSTVVSRCRNSTRGKPAHCSVPTRTTAATSTGTRPICIR